VRDEKALVFLNKWTEEEEEELIYLSKKHAKNYKLISTLIPRSYGSIMHKILELRRRLE
jgi:hypothetical protein